MLCLFFPFTLVQALPIDTDLDTSLTAEAVATNASAQPGLPEEVSASSNALTEAEDGQLLWPMTPGDTLERLARTFYPDSPILQQRFMQKTLRLTRELGLVLKQDVPFKRVQVIAIPDEKEVRAVTHRIKRLQDITQVQNQLKLSYQLKLGNQLKHQIPPPPKPEGLPKSIASAHRLVPSEQTTLSHRFMAIWHSHLSTTKTWLCGAWSALQAYGQTVSATWRHHLPAFNHRLSKPQWQAAMYAALMALIVITLWRLQKRYSRQQIALLNTITETLEETADASVIPASQESNSNDESIKPDHEQDEKNQAA